MEYQVLKLGDPHYPQRLLERLGKEAPPHLYYHGPLSYLKRFTLAVISADSISGEAMMAANQLLFTLREYEMNYIGGWHSVMETEIFRLGLFRKNITVTLFSAKGLVREDFESFLEDRFCPPLHEFPERDEYFRRGKNGELLMLSVSDPQTSQTARKNVINRNWIACALADAVFVTFATKGTKTYAITKKLIQLKIPIFTADHESNSDVHGLGVLRFNRKTVVKFLENLGAVQSDPEKPIPKTILSPNNINHIAEKTKISEQLSLLTTKENKDRVGEHE